MCDGDAAFMSALAGLVCSSLFWFAVIHNL